MLGGKDVKRVVEPDDRYSWYDGAGGKNLKTAVWPDDRSPLARSSKSGARKSGDKARQHNETIVYVPLLKEPNFIL